MKVNTTIPPTTKGAEEWFTGDVYIDAITSVDEQANLGCSHVRFAPGARTVWHTHPKGQTLYVTDGVGLVCHRGGIPQTVTAGQVVYIEPNEEHWHGAAPDHFMAHLAVQEADDSGNPVTWLEPVTNEEYRAAG